MKDWEEKLKRMLEADKNSSRLIFETDEEKVEFVLSCEKVYRKTTREHIEKFRENGYEGNVDEQRWYRFACYLIEHGHKF